MQPTLSDLSEQLNLRHLLHLHLHLLSKHRPLRGKSPAPDKFLVVLDQPQQQATMEMLYLSGQEVRLLYKHRQRLQGRYSQA